MAAPIPIPETSVRIPSPLAMLLRVNATQAWRKLKAIRQQSRLLSSLIGLFIFGYLVIAFGLFYQGLRFIGQFMGLGGLLVERLMFLLFAFLFSLLLISNLVIGYNNLFRNRETAFLWTLPVPAQTIFRWKFLETSALASWAFVFLIAPLMLAYGLTQRADWHYYLMTPFMVLIFVVLPAVIGMWLAVNLARHVDRRAFQVAMIVIVIGGLTSAALWFRPEALPEDLNETRVPVILERLLGKTNFAQFALLPSYWLASAVVQWAEGAFGAAGFFLLVLLSNVLLFGFVSLTSAGGVFYDAASMVQSRGSVFGQWEWFRNRHNKHTAFTFPVSFGERFFRLFKSLRLDEQAFLLKDVRMFWRDTSQWGQSLMLFGLLGVYVINLRQFTAQLTIPFWAHLISYLNLGACSLNLATLTTRFVFPQFSLEGRRLWIVGMAPLGMERILKLKFRLATCASLTLTLALLWLSCHFIQLPIERTIFFAGAVTVMAFTLNGLAIGLGALYPNFKEENPGKIVSGFGGTLCLVLSFIYILLSILLLAAGSPWWRWTRHLHWMPWAGSFAFLGVSFVFGWIPFRLGLRRVRHFEI